MRTKRVEVVKYDLQWERDFECIRQEILEAVGKLVIAVEHVGSTSVKGMSAKPCIDLDVVIADEAVFPAVARGLAEIGYVHEGDLGIRGREAFAYSGKEHLKRHHLYVCARDSEELRRHLTFRDFLRTHPEAAQRYGAVKEEAARLYPDDIEGYMAHKTPCIEELYRLCGLEDEQ